jgi:protein-disulfide isomerase
MKNKSNVHTSNKEKESSQTILVWILVAIVLQFLVIGGLLFSISNNDSKINEINDKVTRVDSFFASNAPGYGDGSAAGSAGAPSVGSAGAAPSAVVDISSVSFEGEPRAGNPDAKVTVIEYSDYECPFCGKFYSESYGKLKSEYIDTGKINFVFKDFPLGFHDKAIPAAAAANCVLRDLGNEKYFEMHDKMFENQQSMNDANFKKWALELGMDSSSYDGCIVDSSIIDEINADLAEGSSLGVSGTPSFFIDGNLIVGAQPYSVIKAEIERALSE